MKTKLSALLALLCATSAQATNVFINEIHYDNAGSDTGEFVEVVAPENTDLTGWSIVLYNGSSSSLSVYSTLPLTSGLVNIENGYGFTTVYPSSIQNGGPDGIALVDNNNNVVQFLSYEGSFQANNGPAQGQTSIDIGVRESSSTSVGFSLQLAGNNGTFYNDFSWQDPALATPDKVNNAQSFGSGSIIDHAPTVLQLLPLDGENFVAIDAVISVVFSENVNISQVNDIQCSVSGSVAVTPSGTDKNYTFTPNSNFVQGESCSFTINAVDVTDLDGQLDNLAQDVTTSFTIIDESASINLVINEFQADPASDISGDANGDGTRNSSADEFIELVNPTQNDIDVSGWTISDGYGLRHTFPSNSIITAGCAAVIFGGGTPTGEFGGALVQTASTGSVGLNNGGDSIIISNGPISISHTYGSEGSSNQSLNLSPDVTGANYEKHSDIANGALYSPGTQTNGVTFDGCVLPDIAPTVVQISPENNATDVAADTLISVTFSEEVNITQWQDLTCSASGNVSLTGPLNGQEFSLTPAQQLANEEVCTFNIPAASVSDVDGTADQMISDINNTFTTETLLSCNAGSIDLISAIQGNGTQSPIVGESVSIKGVVTAVFPDIEAFFMQEEANDHDGDPATSEGIFVYNKNNDYSTPSVNDLVLVEGTVNEFYNRTQINLSRSPIACGQEQVNATLLTLPFASADEAESLEGMLVTNAQPLIVSDNYSLGRYGEVVLSSTRLYTPTNVYLPGSNEAQTLAANNALDRVILDDGQNGSNPENILFPSGGLSASNTLRGGDTVSLLTGVMDYSFSNYRVIPTQEPVFSPTNSRKASPELVLGNLKVASLNVLNYFNTLDQGNNKCGPNNSLDCRGADSSTEFDRQKAKTVAAIIAMDADIVGLMEIENNGFGANSAIDNLVNAINAQMGAGTYAIVDAGSPIGTDAITVALIYKPSVVNTVGGVNILSSSNSISDGNGPLFNDGKNRPAVTQKFTLVENGEELAISVNHFKSKGSSCGAGDDDAVTGQGNCNLTRTRAAQALTSFMSSHYPDTASLILGDLNAYAKEDPIRAIEQAGYTNLVHHFGGDKAYSYTFYGQVGYLDHALANAKALAKVVDVTEWHINADEPTVLDYNTEYKTNNQLSDLYSSDAFRMSDHDPVIIAMDLTVNTPAPTTSLDVNQDTLIDFADYFAILNILGSQTGDQNFNALADYDTDGVISPLDLQAWYQQYLSQ